MEWWSNGVMGRRIQESGFRIKKRHEDMSIRQEEVQPEEAQKTKAYSCPVTLSAVEG